MVKLSIFHVYSVGGKRSPRPSSLVCLLRSVAIIGIKLRVTMKVKISGTRWLIASLLLWLAAVSLAQAFYNPSTGRWLNRDPFGEAGFELLRGKGSNLFGDGPNVFEFVKNDPLNRYDALGLLLGQNYGNWCGFSRSGQGGEPIDEVDSACKRHDNCLATWADALNPSNFCYCHYRFCYDVKYANCERSPDPVACLEFKGKVLVACPPIIFVIP